MNNSNLAQIKRSRKESALLREISNLIHQLSLEDHKLLGLTINRVELSKNKGTCLIYFYDPNGIEAWKEKNKQLILYRPSLRKSISNSLNPRYTPELRFLYDEQFDKQQHIETLINKVSEDLKKNSTDK